MIIQTFQNWECPACGLKDQSKGILPNRFHRCPKLHGLTTPLVLAGTPAKVEIRLREDYAGTELVQTDDIGRPVMSVITTRDNGQDVIVYAPTATAKGEA